jgi:hypothetical protein
MEVSCFLPDNFDVLVAWDVIRRREARRIKEAWATGSKIVVARGGARGQMQYLALMLVGEMRGGEVFFVCDEPAYVAWASRVCAERAKAHGRTVSIKGGPEAPVVTLADSGEKEVWHRHFLRVPSDTCTWPPRLPMVDAVIVLVRNEGGEEAMGRIAAALAPHMQATTRMVIVDAAGTGFSDRFMQMQRGQVDIVEIKQRKTEQT